MERLSRIAAVAQNTHRETVRERVLYNLVFFAILMIASGWLMSQLSVRQDERIIKDLGLASMDVFGTLIAVFIGVGLVSKEIRLRSLHPILSKPLSRGEFLLGKFLGLNLTLLVNLSVMVAGLYATLLATGRALDPRLLVAVFAIYLSLVLTVAIALMFSALSSSVVAALCTLAVVVIGRFANVIRDMKTVLPDAPIWITRGVYLAVPNFRNFDIKSQIVHGDLVTGQDVAWLGLYALVYSAAALVIAYEAFKRRDLV